MQSLVSNCFICIRRFGGYNRHVPIRKSAAEVEDEIRKWEFASFESGRNDVYSLEHDPFFVLRQ